MNLEPIHAFTLAIGSTGFLVDWLFFRERLLKQNTYSLDFKNYLNSNKLRFVRNFCHAIFVGLIWCLITYFLIKSNIINKFHPHFRFEGSKLIFATLAIIFSVITFVITHTFGRIKDDTARLLSNIGKQRTELEAFHFKQELSNQQSIAFQECATEHIRNIVEFAQGNEETHKKLNSYEQFLEFLIIDFKDEFLIKHKLMEISKNTSEANLNVLQHPKLKQFLEKLLEYDNYSDKTTKVLRKLIH